MSRQDTPRHLGYSDTAAVCQSSRRKRCGPLMSRVFSVIWPENAPLLHSGEVCRYEVRLVRIPIPITMHAYDRCAELCEHAIATCSQYVYYTNVLVCEVLPMFAMYRPR